MPARDVPLPKRLSAWPPEVSTRRGRRALRIAVAWLEGALWLVLTDIAALLTLVVLLLVALGVGALGAETDHMIQVIHTGMRYGSIALSVCIGWVLVVCVWGVTAVALAEMSARSASDHEG